MAAQKPHYELLYLISHALRSPVTHLRWGLDLLDNDDFGPLNKEQQALVHELSGRTRELATVMNAMFLWQQLETAVVEPQIGDVDVCRLTRDVLEHLEDKLQARDFNGAQSGCNELVVQTDANILEIILQCLFIAVDLKTGSNDQFKIIFRSSPKPTLTIESTIQETDLLTDATGGTPGLLFSLANELTTILGFSLAQAGNNSDIEINFSAN